MVFNGSLELSTRGHADTHDITNQVEQILQESGVQAGLVTVFTPSATSSLTTIEYESGALSDLKRALDEIAPPERDYAHNLRWGDGNGHAHLRAALLKPTISIPVVGGRMTLGTWQQILFIDFDVHSRQRKLVVQVMGDLG
jgi:secondary thiamine-phosphate synthase enzyme